MGKANVVRTMRQQARQEADEIEQILNAHQTNPLTADAITKAMLEHQQTNHSPSFEVCRMNEDYKLLNNKDLGGRVAKVPKPPKGAGLLKS